MSFVGIEINDSKVTKISGNTVISTSKDSIGIKINNSDDTIVDKDNAIIAGKTIVIDDKEQ